MKYIFFIFLTALTASTIAQVERAGGVPPVQEEILINSKKESAVYFFKMNEAYLEAPPTVQPGGWHSYFVSTHFTKVFSTPVSLGDDDLSVLDLERAPSVIVSSSLTWWNKFLNPSSVSNYGLQFRRNYLGVTGVHSLSTTGKGNIVVAYQHGENKNEICQGNAYNNTVWPEMKIDPNNPDTYSGFIGDDYHEDWNSYFGFLNMGWMEDIEATGWAHKYYWEAGPVAWPSNGYITPDRKKASLGIRHPSSIRYGNYIYIYFLDTKTSNMPAEEGREAGLKVARVLANEAWNEKAYQVYYNGGWQASLPAGFSKENMETFFDKKGPKSTVILPTPDHNMIKFSVAKLNGTSYFLGVEEYNFWGNPDICKVVLRLSTDLIHWSAPKYEVSSSTQAGSRYHYPVFMDKGGWSNDNIHKSEFYILGTQTGQLKAISRLKLNLDIAFIIGRTSVDDVQIISKDDVPETKNIIKTYQENNILHIATNDNSSRKVVYIYSALGQLMHQQTVDGANDTFDIETGKIQITGLYMLVIESNNITYSKKLFLNK